MISKIWKDYWKSVKTAAHTFYVAIKEVLRTTFDLFKNTLVVFVYGVYDWLVALIKGCATTIWDFIKFVCYGLLEAVLATLKELLVMIVNFILKW